MGTLFRSRDDGSSDMWESPCDNNLERHCYVDFDCECCSICDASRCHCTRCDGYPYDGRVANNKYLCEKALPMTNPRRLMTGVAAFKIPLQAGDL